MQDEDDLTVGVPNRYRIDAPLGAGGMGEVYLAYDTTLRRQVAIKFLSGEPNAVSRAKLLGEARAASALNHPNICTIYEVAEADGQTCIVMEYVQGTVLKAMIPSGGLPSEIVVRYGLQISDAMRHAHANGIVHRDLKSSNIIVTPEGRVKVLDFGLAHRLSEQELEGFTRHASPIETGSLAGTFAYMAPEVLRGAPADARSDVWALGILLYEMACGAVPFKGLKSFDQAAVIVNQPIPMSVVPSAERTIIQRCLEKETSKRYQNAGEVRTALERGQASREPSRGARVWIAAAASIILAIAFATGYRQWKTPRERVEVVPGTPITGAAPVQARRAVAVLGFKNLSGQASAAWLSTALSEMLTTELAAGEALRTIPGENVARMRNDLTLADADSFAPDTLARIRSNLGTDLVVVGSYLAVGEQLRFDVRLQDARAGETVASVAETGSDRELLELVSRIGARLRNRLGVATLSAAEATRVQASMPSSPKAARLYAEGLAKLRLYDAQAASALLEQAVAADPTLPLAHSALALAWSALGYDERAKASAKRAYDLSSNLTREDRLWVEGRYHETINERDKAIETYQRLFGFFPDNLDYGLRLAAAQTSAGKGKDALTTIASLRRIQPVSDDPRIDLAEAEAARALSDFTRQQGAAERAAAKGRAQGSRLLVARARLSEGTAWQDLGEPAKAMAANEEARQIYAAAGDRGGQGRALRSVAVVLRSQGDLSGAREMYQRALATFREIGDRSGIALTLNNIANVLRQQGSLEEAKNVYEESLMIFREVGDKSNESNVLNNAAIGLRQQGDLAGAKRNYAGALAIRRAIGEKVGVAASMNNLANVLYDEGDLGGARKMYEDALAIRQEIGDKKGVAIAWFNIAGVLRLQGDLEGAKTLYDRSLSVARETEDKSSVASALVSTGAVLTYQGRLAEARTRYEEALAIQETIGEKSAAAASRVALGELTIEEGRPAEAEALARQAVEQFHAQSVADGEGNALAVLARSLLAQKKLRDADETIERAVRLVGTARGRETRFTIGVVAARVDAASGKQAAASQKLRGLLAEAKGFVGDELEAGLALGEVEIASGNVAAGKSRLEALEKEAQAKGFLLTARKAAVARR